METESEGHQGRLAAISRDVVVLLKGLVGRGPTNSKTYIHDDCVILLLREGHTRGEETMFEAGGSRAVAQGRVDISETIRDPLIEVIERHTDRKVVGFLSSSQQDPDLLSFVFVLDSSPLLEAIDGEGEVRAEPRAVSAAQVVIEAWAPRGQGASLMLSRSKTELRPSTQPHVPGSMRLSHQATPVRGASTTELVTVRTRRSESSSSG
jgi:uncharacterized protein YbcI